MSDSPNPFDAIFQRSRERPWRVTHTSTSFEPEQTDDAREAVEALERSVIERAGAQFADWQQRRDEAEPGWAEPTGIAQSLVYLTLDEMAALHRACCWAPARPSSACWT